MTKKSSNKFTRYITGQDWGKVESWSSPEYEEYYEQRNCSEYENPNTSYVSSNVTDNTSSKLFLGKVVLVIVTAVIVLSGFWWLFGYCDGSGWYRKNPKACNMDKAIWLFQHGRYIDASDCFSGFYKRSTQMEKEYRFVANRMAFYTRRLNNHKDFRIFFKTPYAFDISNAEKLRYGLPDFVKSEIYEMVTNVYDKDGMGRETIYDPQEIACYCYKMCGDYKDSKQRFQHIAKFRISKLIEKEDFEVAEEFVKEITDKQEAEALSIKIKNAKLEAAKAELAAGDLNSAREELQKIATSKASSDETDEANKKEAKELLKTLDFKFMCMLGLHIRDYLDKEKVRQNTDAMKALAQKRQEAIDYFVNKHGIKKEDIVAFCRNKLNEFGDEACQKEDYLSAYNYYSQALKCSPYNTKALECAQNMAKASRKLGSVVLLGHYEQDGVAENGPEPIEWIITAISDDKALLLSKYILATGAMHNNSDKDQEWRDSNLRKWLNESFYNEAFNDEERKELLQMELSSKDYGNRSIYGMGIIENPFLNVIVGNKDYTPPVPVLDYVTCPDMKELKMLEERFDLVAYATPEANTPERYREFLKYYPKSVYDYYMNANRSGRGFLFFSKISGKETESSKGVTDNSSSITPEANVKCFGPCAYWLRNWSSSSNRGTQYRIINEYGFDNRLYSDSKRIGIRPEIMIRLSADEAVKREKDGLEKTQDAFINLIKLRQLEIELKKKGLIESKSKSKWKIINKN